MRDESYIGHIPGSVVQGMRENDRLVATSDLSCAGQADTLSICVPTPLDKARQPDLTAVRNTAESLVPHLRPRQLVILESTTYSGTTTEVVLPILQKSARLRETAPSAGKRSFSPENWRPKCH
jgi:UDP-N-acetyl-D-glucosamine dehydrogenase